MHLTVYILCLTVYNLRLPFVFTTSDFVFIGLCLAITGLRFVFTGLLFALNGLRFAFTGLPLYHLWLSRDVTKLLIEP